MRYEYKNDVDVDTINVVQFGLGPIGINAVKEAMKKDMREAIGYDARSRLSPAEFAAEVDAGLRKPLPPKRSKKKK